MLSTKFSTSTRFSTNLDLTDKHYTYTLPQETDQSTNQDRDDDGNMCDDNTDRGSEHEAPYDVHLESALSFVQIN